MKVNSVFDDLKWRGLMFQSTDEVALKDALDNGSIKYYCGFDPTAKSLHIGNLVQIIVLKHLQLAGHSPFCVVGGATGLVGDPRQSGERTMNDKETVALWSKTIETQLRRFLDFDPASTNAASPASLPASTPAATPTLPNPATLVNNYDWTSTLSAIDFLRDVGKNFRMGAMLAKDTVKTRLADDGLSFTEFSYQVLQGYDFYVLNRDYGVTLQTGGQDQWGNLTSGVDLIGRIGAGSDMGKPAVHAMTTPLITDNNGNKYGKSEGGAIWIDAEMMSPYEFYQFWLNRADDEVIRLLKIFTFLSRGEIERLEREVEANPGARLAQRTLAAEVTKFVHSEAALSQAVSASAALFGRGDLEELDFRTLRGALAGVTTVRANVGDALAGLFVDAGLASSNSDFRKTLAAGGYYINNEKVTDLEQTLVGEDLLADRYAILRKGKKTIAGIDIIGENIE